MGTDNNEEEIKQNLQLKDKSADGTHNDEPADAMQEKTDTDGNRTDAAASPDPDAAGIEEKEQSGRNTGNSSRYMDPGAKWAAENAKATGADVEKNMKSAGIPGHIDLCFPKARRKCPRAGFDCRNCRDTGAEYGSKRRNGRNCKHSRAGADGSFRKYSGS